MRASERFWDDRIITVDFDLFIHDVTIEEISPFLSNSTGHTLEESNEMNFFSLSITLTALPDSLVKSETLSRLKIRLLAYVTNTTQSPNLRVLTILVFWSFKYICAFQSRNKRFISKRSTVCSFPEFSQTPLWFQTKGIYACSQVMVLTVYSYKPSISSVSFSFLFFFSLISLQNVLAVLNTDIKKSWTIHLAMPRADRQSLTQGHQDRDNQWCFPGVRTSSSEHRLQKQIYFERKESKTTRISSSSRSGQ